MTGPSVTGSENGMPISMASGVAAPAAAHSLDPPGNTPVAVGVEQFPAVRLGRRGSASSILRWSTLTDSLEGSFMVLGDVLVARPTG